MSAIVWIDDGPLRQKLSQELEAVAVGLRDFEKLVEEYFSKDLPQYQSWLNHHFSEKLCEISDLEKKVSSLGFHIEESIHVSLKMNLRPQDLFANKSEEEIYQQIMAEDIVEEVIDFYAASEQGKEIANDDVREIYRRIIRCIHPDLRGMALTENEKNLWVKAQQAYAQNDSFELCRLERCLKCGALDEPLSCSEMLRQLSEFQKRYEELQREIDCLQKERAWQFSERKSILALERVVVAEFQGTLRDLKSKEAYLHKTLTSWITQDVPTAVAPNAKTRRRAPKEQQSLF